MATFDYNELKAEVDLILTEFGQACKLTRPKGPLDIDPVTGTVEDDGLLAFDVIGVITDYSEKALNGETILRGDREAYIQATTRPAIGDTFIEESGKTWAVIDFSAVDPAGTAVVFALHLRR